MPRPATEGRADPEGATTPVLDPTPEMPAALRRALPIFAPGEVVANRFRVERFLAAGGMGQVFEAFDLELQYRVALKTLRPDLVSDSRALERFRREVRLAHQVTHPNVCRTFDVHRHRRGDGAEVAFLAMELLEGPSLSEHLRAGRLSPDQALPILAQVAAGLDAAHAAGVVHRDLKSANVLLVSRGPSERPRVVITDFGIATAPREGPAPDAGSVVGTPAYMAPEQVSGEAATARSDVFALGVILYEMLTGRRPYEGDTPVSLALARLGRAATSPREHVGGLPAVWERAILRCLERDPARRYASAGELLLDLLGERARRTRQALAAAAIAALAVAGLGTGAALWQRTRPPAPPPAAPLAARRAVLLLAPRDAGGDREAAWLSTALAELLASELRSEELRPVTAEKLDSADAEGLPGLRARTGADLVLASEYRLSAGNLQLQLRATDATSGGEVVSLAQGAPLGDLVGLVARCGASLRRGLGVAASRGSGPLPVDSEAARLHAEGLARLRAHDALAARVELQKAVAADPENPLPRVSLSQAWAALGHDAKAREEARLAYQLAAGLPLRDRLLVEARYREAAAEWGRAEALYHQLAANFPDELDHLLRLAAVQVAAGRAADGLAALEARPGQDARWHLALSEAAAAVSDFARSRDAARLARERAEQVGAGLLAAEARQAEAWARYRLGELAEAEALAREARAAFAAAGDGAAAARALNVSAVVTRQRGDAQAALGLYRQVLEQARQVGDQRLTAQALNNIAVVLNELGDLAGARRSYQEALALAREVGDRRSVAIRLSNLAVSSKNEGDLAGARRLYEEALATARSIGDRGTVAMASNNLGALLVSQAELGAARSLLEGAVASFMELGDRRRAAFALYSLGEALLAQGDVAGARRRHEEALALRTALGEKVNAADSRAALAGVALAEGLPEVAASLAREAAEAAAAARQAELEAQARALLAEALLRLGRREEAQAAGLRALELVRDSQRFELRVRVALARARLHATGPTSDVDAAVGALLRSADDAERAGFTLLDLEARCAAGELELAAGRFGAARARLSDVARRASLRGAELLARRARKLAGA